MKKDQHTKIIEEVSRHIADIILFEEDELYRQAALSKKIDHLKLRATGDKEEAITDEQDDDPFAEEEAEDDAGEEEVEEETEEAEETEEETGEADEDETAGEKKGAPEEDFTVAPPEDIPAQITISQVTKQINNMRAGKSLKDKEISTELEGYFDELGEGEKQALFIYLASLASILTGGSSGDLAPSPQALAVDIDPEVEEEKEEEITTTPGQSRGTPESPIIVGESADIFGELMFVLENMSTAKDSHRCLGGHVVPFGSSECVSDLDARISDMTHQRDSLERASADRASLNGTLKFLRQKKRKANKILQQDQELDLQSKINLSDEL